MRWSILGDRAVGMSHRTHGLPCQDAFRVRTFGAADDWLVVAVADGAGSATHAEVGAALACEEFVKRLPELVAAAAPTRETLIALFGAVRAELAAEAERRGVQLRELACTALVAVIGPEAAFFAQVGDGAIVIDTEDEHRTVFWPESGEYANMTHFLTEEHYAETTQVETIPRRIGELAVLTDGLQRLALDFETRRPHPDFFQPMFATLRDSTQPQALAEPFRQFLDSPRVNERTDDDKTLVLAIRSPAHESTSQSD